MPAILKPSNFIWGGDGLGHQLTYLAGGGGGEGGFINQELPLCVCVCVCVCGVCVCVCACAPFVKFHPICLPCPVWLLDMNRS